MQETMIRIAPMAVPDDLRHYFGEREPDPIRFAVVQSLDPALAEDVVQETLVAAEQGCEQFAGRSSIIIRVFSMRHLATFLILLDSWDPGIGQAGRERPNSDRGTPTVHDALPLLRTATSPPPHRRGLATAQINPGCRFNRSCSHCHAHAEPGGTKQMGLKAAYKRKLSERAE